MLAKISWRFILILLSGGAIAFFTYQYLDSLQQTETIIVAEGDIPEQTEITEEMLTTITVEAQSADLLISDRVVEIDQIVGAITREDISEGQPMQMDPEMIVFQEQRAEFMTDDGRIDRSSFIPDEIRLYTLALEPHASVDNSLESGDYVDVLFTGEEQETGQSYSRMIIQYAEVYEVESFDESALGNLAKDSMVQHITLMVSPQESVALANAKSAGELSLVLNSSQGEQEDVDIIYESTMEN
ncbi:Flp pilus assembly protein CpaB [Geomicrobium sp. JSM 1781026]|uniref:Flp pilus assembly protein CpaB n=1 Tax=Geomicrobium sp. JSM 1781026 TaxID=3344580 RepID=UPI0035C0B47A